MRINNNISAMNTYSRLNSANNAKSGSLAKLSSGLRINRAGDDAAGLAISEKMRGQIGGLKQATRNAQDGISLIQTAEGALNETHSILNRMRELAVQSSSDTNTPEDREEIQKEMNELATEISRISRDTEFNTQGLLNGKLNSTFHIGANKGQNLKLEISDMGAKALGLETASKQTATVNGTSYETKNADIKSIEVTVTAGTGNDNGSAVATLGEDGKLTLSVVTENGSGTKLTEDALNEILKEHGVKASGTMPTIAATADFEAKVEDVGNIKDAYVNVADDSITELKFAANAAGTDISITKDSAGKVSVTAGQGVTFEDLNEALKDYGIVMESNDKDVNGETTVGTITGAAVELDVDAGNIPIRVDTQEAADKAIKTIDDAIGKVSAERSKLGATQNRLDHTINNLTATAENLSEAESRIRDVDMAEEMMEFTKNNILSQAATSMLAQANQMPQSVLQLLQ